MSTAAPQAYTPTRSGSRAAATAAAAAAAEYTPSMRERQARGKDPYSSDSDYDDAPERRVRLGRGVRTEPFEDKERRGFALSVLDCPESLIMYALGEGDSVPGQRLRFMAVMCGFEERRKSTDVVAREREKERERRR